MYSFIPSHNTKPQTKRKTSVYLFQFHTYDQIANFPHSRYIKARLIGRIIGGNVIRTMYENNENEPTLATGILFYVRNIISHYYAAFW